ncbi:MAG: diaminopimelate epimerase [Lachnospiraceae bacterium]|nr:diaminopimelate epimerase [Lachnospiraceae bacterium]
MKFTKMHGCGNDYVYVNLFEEKIDDFCDTAIKVSDRHFGIGSDGLICIAPSEVADVRMIMYNLDGSEGEMCGNGIRCVAKYSYDHGLVDKDIITVETKAGIKTLELNVENGKVSTVKVNMGAPIMEPEKIPVVSDKSEVISEPITVNGKEYKFTAVSMGNPHSVIFVDETKDLPLAEMGPYFENHEFFPARVNTEFIQVLSRNEINMRVWERGSGETLACGTGACASVVACVKNGLTDNKVTVHLLGGDLVIEYNEEENTVYMTGPATESFSGVWEG